MAQVYSSKVRLCMLNCVKWWCVSVPGGRGTGPWDGHGACSAVKAPGDSELASLGLQCEMSLALTLGVPKSKVIE